jgi:O-antigen/teichoic acid export membrane protein
LRQRFSQNIRWQFIANGIQALLGGAYLIVLGRFLGPAEFGVFSAVMAVVSVMGLLFEMRLQEVVARDFCRLDDKVKSNHLDSLRLFDLFVLETFSRVIPLFVLLLLSDWLLYSISLEHQDAALLLLAAVGFTVSKCGSSVSTGLLRVLGRTDLIAGCMAIDWGLRLVITGGVALALHLDVRLALWIALVIGIACNLIQICLACKEFTNQIGPISLVGWNIFGAFDRLRSARRLIISNLGVSGSDLMAKDLDVALISSMLSAEKVGLYKMSKSFVQVIWRGIDPFYITIMPEIQKLWQLRDFDEVRRLLKKTTIRLFYLSILLVTISNLFVVSFGQILLGNEYKDISQIMMIMSIWILISAPLIWGSALAIAVGRPEISVGGTALGLFVGLVAFYVFVPLLGLLGAGIAWSLTILTGVVFIALVATIYASKEFKLGKYHGE